MNKGLYVYGLMQERKDEEITCISGIDNTNHLFQVALDDIYLVVSEVELEEYGEGKINEKLEDMLWVGEKAKTHFYIINHLTKGRDFIPIKFCTIFLNEENLKMIFSKYADKIKEAFEYFKDKEEWTFKVYCDRKKFIENNMDEEKAELDNQVTNVSIGAAYFMKKKLSASLEEKAREKIGRIKEELWKELNGKVEKVKLNSNLSSQVTDRKEEMILNTALLISKGKINEICECLEDIKNKLNLSCMSFELVGPWPFYNFAELFIS